MLISRRLNKICLYKGKFIVKINNNIYILFDKENFNFIFNCNSKRGVTFY